jgi:ABC-2 type transport system permease protein
MRNVFTIASREYKHFFATPAAYMVAFLVLLVLGRIFYLNLEASMLQTQFQGSPPPNSQIAIGPLVTIFLFATPAITMRLLAEEQRLGTIELLLTAPVRDWELVVGKWLGGILFLLTIIAITLIFPFVLNAMISPGIDQGLMIANYLGIILFASALVAIGVAISSFFSNQIAAFFATLAVFLLLWLLAGQAGTLLGYLDFGNHFYNTFFNGIIELTDIVYYLSITALALLIGTLSVEWRRWR